MQLSWLARGRVHLPSGEGWLSEGELRRARGMRFTKRRDEFLIARWTAKQAIGRICSSGTEPARIEIRHHRSGAPEAYGNGCPLDVSISLTDRADWAVCLLGPPHVRIGCDLELVEARSTAFVQDYFTGAERRRIAGDDLAANLFWSAKESALKVLRTGLRRDTRSVEVTVDDPPSGGGWAPLTVRAVEGRVFPGWWIRFGDFLLTVAADQETPHPCSLDEPPALASAVPTHGWLS
ncbi:4'-phosphopantetheinyl transferase family protein [Spirillospora sp. NPDC048911]|uniref:4'-phosphopantetheinyl transferase family protein n=1 Tax=Spirillospora sp. NPDC048911 TaxID=3364527 RepID=UPI00370FA60E